MNHPSNERRQEKHPASIAVAGISLLWPQENKSTDQGRARPRENQ